MSVTYVVLVEIAGASCVLGKDSCGVILLASNG